MIAISMLFIASLFITINVLLDFGSYFQCKLLLIFTLCFCQLFAPHVGLAQEYLGVASCASSNCHGNVTGKKASNVLQNEYVTWKRHDSHAKAWEVLTNSDSKKIGRHLGINEPEKAKLCLSCHSTATHDAVNTSTDKFRIEDGVGCESCHGPASNWIKKHTASGTSHTDNLANGMNDIVSPLLRSKSCLPCHLGSEKAEVNHKLIGAGHPRLSFELETFSEIQPRHWNFDQDYEQRKGLHNPTQNWLVGQISRTIGFLELFLKSAEKDLIPDFTFFNCYSCHHSLKEDQWKKRDYHGAPGKLNLNLSSLVLTNLALEVLDKSKAEALQQKITALNSPDNRENQLTAAKDLVKFLEQALDKISALEISEESTKSILANVKKYAANNPDPQYELAEQLIMAINVLSGEKSEKYKAVYKALEDEEGYRAEKFSEAVRLLR